MSHHHERQVCRCGLVIMQCRCPERKTDVVVCETCIGCVATGRVPYPSNPEGFGGVAMAQEHAPADAINRQIDETIASRILGNRAGLGYERLWKWKLSSEVAR